MALLVGELGLKTFPQTDEWCWPSRTSQSASLITS